MERLPQVPTLLHTPNCPPASCQCLALAKYGYPPAMLRDAEIITNHPPPCPLHLCLSWQGAA